MSSTTVNQILRRTGVTIGMAMAQRQIEETLEPVLERGILTKMGESELLQEMAVVIREIPFVRVAGVGAISAVGAILGESAESLFPGRTDPFTKSMRFALKRLGPQLSFASNIGADALERALRQKAGGIISSERIPTADRHAELDQGVFLWLDEFPGKILVPAQNPDGSIKLDGENLPIILDPEVMAKRYSEQYTRRTTRMVGSGKDRKPVTDPPQRPNIIGPFALRDAVRLVDMGQFSPGDAEAILKLLAPKAGYFQSWGDDVWDVLIAYNLGLERKLRELGDSNPLIHEESEGLIQTLLAAKPDVELVRRLIGAFKRRILRGGERDGELHPDAINGLEQVVFDMWLGGEQPRWTKIQKRAKRIMRSAHLQNISMGRLAWNLFKVASPILVPIVVCAILFVSATSLYLKALLGDITQPVQTGIWGVVDGVSFALFAGLVASWMLFGMEQIFKLFRTMTGFLADYFEGWSEEKIYGILRKIRIFAFLLPGLNAYLVYAAVDPTARHALLTDLRLVIPHAVGMMIAIASMLVDAGYIEDVNKSVRWASKPLSIVLVVVPLVLAFVFTFSTGHPTQATAVHSGVTDAWSWLQHSKYLQTMLALAVIILLGVGIRWIERAKVVGTMAIKERIPGSRWVLIAGGVLSVLYVWFHEPAKAALGDINLINSEVNSADITVSAGGSKLRVRQQEYENGDVRTQVKGRITVQPPSPSAPAPTRTSPTTRRQLCAQGKVDFDTCHGWGYK